MEPIDWRIIQENSVRDSRVAKISRPSGYPHVQAIIDLSATEDGPDKATTKSPIRTTTDHGHIMGNDVYLVMLDHTHPEMGDDTNVFAVCSDLEDANIEARRCLFVQHGITPVGTITMKTNKMTEVCV